MKNLQLQAITFITRKLGEEKGESHSMSEVGWAVVAIMIAIAVYTVMPDKVTSLINSVFSKFNTGLGL